jgi:hypothetical protein
MGFARALPILCALLYLSKSSVREDFVGEYTGNRWISE